MTREAVRLHLRPLKAAQTSRRVVGRLPSEKVWDKAHRRNRVFELRKKKRSLAEIARALGTTPAVVDRDLQFLRDSVDPKKNIFPKKIPRRQETPVLSPELERFRTGRVLPLVREKMARLRRKYPKFGDFFDELDNLAEWESYYMAERFRPLDSPKLESYVSKTVRGLFLRALVLQTKSRTGLRISEVLKLQGIFSDLKKGKSLEQICSERKIAIQEAHALLGAYRAQFAIPLESLRQFRK